MLTSFGKNCFFENDSNDSGIRKKQVLVNRAENLLPSNKNNMRIKKYFLFIALLLFVSFQNKVFAQNVNSLYEKIPQSSPSAIFNHPFFCAPRKRHQEHPLHLRRSVRRDGTDHRGMSGQQADRLR